MKPLIRLIVGLLSLLVGAAGGGLAGAATMGLFIGSGLSVDDMSTAAEIAGGLVCYAVGIAVGLRVTRLVWRFAYAGGES